MGTDINYKQLGLQNASSGITDEIGFVGHYEITNQGIIDLGKDLWKEGTQYSFYPLETESEQFLTFVFNKLVLCTPKDFFSLVTNLACRIMYVPMAVVDTKLVCLNGRMPELSYGFFQNGTIDQSVVSRSLGQPIAFDLKKIDYRRIDCLSMTLAVKDIWYVANSLGINSKNENIQVVLLPIHYMTFDYIGEHYVAMSLGDSQMTGFWSNQPFPQDDILRSKKILYNYPWITMCLMFSWILAVVVTVIVVCVKLWSSLNMFVLYKLVIFSIPIFLIYVIAWYVMLAMAWLLGHSLLFGEMALSRWLQRRAIWRNMNQKKGDIKQRFSKYDVSFPNVEEIFIDVSNVKDCFIRLIERLKSIKAIIKNNLKIKQ